MAAAGNGNELEEMLLAVSNKIRLLSEAVGKPESEGELVKDLTYGLLDRDLPALRERLEGRERDAVIPSPDDQEHGERLTINEANDLVIELKIEWIAAKVERRRKETGDICEQIIKVGSPAGDEQALAALEKLRGHISELAGEAIALKGRLFHVNIPGTISEKLGELEAAVRKDEGTRVFELTKELLAGFLPEFEGMRGAAAGLPDPSNQKAALSASDVRERAIAACMKWTTDKISARVEEMKQIVELMNREAAIENAIALDASLGELNGKIGGLFESPHTEGSVPEERRQPKLESSVLSDVNFIRAQGYAAVARIRIKAAAGAWENKGEMEAQFAEADRWIAKITEAAKGEKDTITRMKMERLDRFVEDAKETARANAAKQVTQVGLQRSFGGRREQGGDGLNLTTTAMAGKGSDGAMRHSG